METTLNAARMSFPGGKYDRTFHPNLATQLVPPQRKRHSVPTWADHRRVQDENTLTCYESMVAVADGMGYTQDIEDFMYFRKTVRMLYVRLSARLTDLVLLWDRHWRLSAYLCFGSEDVVLSSCE